MGKLISLTYKVCSHHEASGIEAMIPLKSIKAALLLHCVALEFPKLEITQSSYCPLLFSLVSSAESAQTSYPQSTQAMMYNWNSPIFCSLCLYYTSDTTTTVERSCSPMTAANSDKALLLKWAFAQRQCVAKDMESCSFFLPDSPAFLCWSPLHHDTHCVILIKWMWLYFQMQY